MKTVARMTRLAAVLIFSATSLAVGLTAAPAPEAKAEAEANTAYRFIGGQWFDGKQFVQRSVCAKGRLFVDCSELADESFTGSVLEKRLTNLWMVPPYGDAHTHNFSNLRSAIGEQYLEQGVFYVQVLNTTTSTLGPVKERVNRRDTVEVTFANGGLTSTLSHPAPLYESLHLGVFTKEEKEARREEIQTNRFAENDAYWLIDSKADLDTKWPLYLAGEPDLVKIYLTEAVAGLPAPPPGSGLQPELVPEVLRLAKAANLRVFAHTATVSDFRIALAAGVDGFAHLPGFEPTKTTEWAEWTEADLELVRRQQPIVAPTASIYLEPPYGPAPPEARRNYFRSQLQALHAAGAKIVLGTDSWLQTSVTEALALDRLEAFDRPTLLRLWSETTPQAIFPKRKIGHIEPGYEASFLALGANPLQSFDATQDIRYRFKQGLELAGPDPEPQP